MKNKGYLAILLPMLVLFCSYPNCTHAQNKKLNVVKIDKKNTMQQFFKYKGDGSIIISGHRGGNEPGFPENSIAGLGNVLTKIPAIFEIDPRLTYDGVAVLMHDATIDRTTTGKGRVADYTYAHLKQVRLKDKDNNHTTHTIPTLEEVIIWSQGKTILNLDHKDLPASAAIALIKKHKAHNIMFTVHNKEQAQYIYKALGNQTMFSAFIRTMEEYQEYEKCGIPWENFIAYVGPMIAPEKAELYKLLRSKGVRCMISVSPTHDKITNGSERKSKYLQEIKTTPDIIESDLPAEVYSVLQSVKEID